MTTLERTAGILGAFLVLGAGAAVSVFVETIPVAYVVAVAVVATAAYAALSVIGALRRRIRELELGHRDERLGLENVYESPDGARPDLYAAISDAEEHVVLVGISHRSLLADDAFFKAVDRFLSRRGTRLDILFTAPTSDALSQRASDEGYEPETFIADVRANWSRFQTWIERHRQPESVRLLYYDVYPDWRIQMVDRRAIFVSSYPPGRTGQHSAVIRLEPTEFEGSLFEAFEGITSRLVGTGRRAEPDDDSPELDPVGP